MASMIVTAESKVPVGLRLGDAENATVVTAVLADLVDHGLDATGGVLVVIDGGKALAAGVRRVFGEHAVIQRCVLHYAEQRIMPTWGGFGSLSRDFALRWSAQPRPVERPHRPLCSRIGEQRASEKPW